MLSMINKIIPHIDYKRLSISLKQDLRNEQAGFRPRRFCIDHVKTLRVVVEQSVERRFPLYLCLIHFEKAFDTLRHDTIWSVFACEGVPEKINSLLMDFYTAIAAFLVMKML